MEEEPQNMLTRKFTDVEWKAVKELRVSTLLPLSHNAPLYQVRQGILWIQADSLARCVLDVVAVW